MFKYDSVTFSQDILVGTEIQNNVRNHKRILYKKVLTANFSVDFTVFCPNELLLFAKS